MWAAGLDYLGASDGLALVASAAASERQTILGAVRAAVNRTLAEGIDATLWCDRATVRNLCVAVEAALEYQLHPPLFSLAAPSLWLALAQFKHIHQRRATVSGSVHAVVEAVALARVLAEKQLSAFGDMTGVIKDAYAARLWLCLSLKRRTMHVWIAILAEALPQFYAEEAVVRSKEDFELMLDLITPLQHLSFLLPESAPLTIASFLALPVEEVTPPPLPDVEAQHASSVATSLHQVSLPPPYEPLSLEELSGESTPTPRPIRTRPQSARRKPANHVEILNATASSPVVVPTSRFNAPTQPTQQPFRAPIQPPSPMHANHMSGFHIKSAPPEAVPRPAMSLPMTTDALAAKAAAPTARIAGGAPDDAKAKSATTDHTPTIALAANSNSNALSTCSNTNNAVAADATAAAFTTAAPVDERGESYWGRLTSYVDDKIAYLDKVATRAITGHEPRRLGGPSPPKGHELRQDSEPPPPKGQEDLQRDAPKPATPERINGDMATEYLGKFTSMLDKFAPTPSSYIAQGQPAAEQSHSPECGSKAGRDFSAEGGEAVHIELPSGVGVVEAETEVEKVQSHTDVAVTTALQAEVNLMAIPAGAEVAAAQARKAEAEDVVAEAAEVEAEARAESEVGFEVKGDGSPQGGPPEEAYVEFERESNIALLAGVDETGLHLKREAEADFLLGSESQGGAGINVTKAANRQEQTTATQPGDPLCEGEGSNSKSTCDACSEGLVHELSTAEAAWMVRLFKEEAAELCRRVHTVDVAWCDAFTATSTRALGLPSTCDAEAQAPHLVPACRAAILQPLRALVIAGQYDAAAAEVLRRASKAVGLPWATVCRAADAFIETIVDVSTREFEILGGESNATVASDGWIREQLLGKSSQTDRVELGESTASPTVLRHVCERSGLQQMLCVSGVLSKNEGDMELRKQPVQLSSCWQAAAAYFEVADWWSLTWGGVELEALARALGSCGPVLSLPQALSLRGQWTACYDAAKVAGTQLAMHLQQRGTGHRPACLLGASLGARVVWHCLQLLAELPGKAGAGLVQDVVLVAAPVTANPARWERIGSVVTGRLINAHFPEDSQLGLLYRSNHLASQGCCGTTAVAWDRVENLNATVHVAHSSESYHFAVPAILDEARII